MRIVIVEDNQALARGLRHRLRDQGHAVDLLDDGIDADAMANAVDEAEAALAAERGITLINEVLGLLRTRTILTELKALTARHGRLRETPPPTAPSPDTPVSASNDNDSKDPLGD